MPISTYAELKAELISYAWRAGDADFEAKTPGLVKMAESRLNRVLPLRVGETEVNLGALPGMRYLALPANFQEPIRLQRTTDGGYADMVAFVAGDLPVSNAMSTPMLWAIDGENIKLHCPCDRPHSFQFRYRGGLALSDAAPTNWLLTNHPDIYLAACCVWGGVYMLDREQAATFKALLDEGVNELAWLEARSKAIAPLRVDAGLNPRGCFSSANGMGDGTVPDVTAIFGITYAVWFNGLPRDPTALPSGAFWNNGGILSQVP